MIEDVVRIQLPVNEALVIRKNRLAPEGVAPDAKRMCIVTGIHGDELEGQFICYEVVRRIKEHPEFLKGIVDVYPAMNPLGIDTISRGIPSFDLDMNRIFPGNPNGAVPEVIANRIIEDIRGADVAIDIHASNIFLREIPQARININTADHLIPLAKLVDVDFVWVHQAVTVLESTLAHSLNAIDVPTLVLEAGVGMRITKEFGLRLVNGLFNLMKHMGIWTGPVDPVGEPIVSSDHNVGFVNADAAGIFVPVVQHWESIKKGETLGNIIDPLSGDIRECVKSPVNGMIFTLREYPVVNPGSLIARILEL